MQRTDVQPNHWTLIDNAVHAAFPQAEWSPVSVLGGGLSASTLYQLAIGDNHYVARLTPPDDPRSILEEEYAATALAAAQGIAPPLYYAEPKMGIMLSAFVQNQPLFRPNGEGPKLVPTLAQLVRTLHQGRAFVQTLSLFEKTEYIFKALSPAFQALPLVVEALALKRKLATILNDPADLRPCHCDLNPNNVLFDGKQLWLIDWTTAGQENFYFDLATCANFFFFRSAEAEEAFLQSYFERPLTETEAEKYAQMRTFCAIYYGLIFIYMSSLRDASPLRNAEIAALPSYPDFMALVRTGQANLSEPVAQQSLGFIYLKRALVAQPAGLCYS